MGTGPEGLASGVSQRTGSGPVPVWVGILVAVLVVGLVVLVASTLSGGDTAPGDDAPEPQALHALA